MTLPPKFCPHCGELDKPVRHYPKTGEYLCDKCAEDLKRKKR
jgi:formylmethanofuran dehydrogenase subunit E